MSRGGRQREVKKGEIQEEGRNEGRTQILALHQSKLNRHFRALFGSFRVTVLVELFLSKSLCFHFAALGKPVGTRCGVDIKKSLCLIIPGVGRQAVLKKFCDNLLRQSEERVAGTFSIYKWMYNYHYWKKDTVALARPMESVVLPKETEKELIRDIDEFLEPETAAWYVKHGVPYKRLVSHACTY